MIRLGQDGLPTEILFEFGESRTYTLVYTYDLAAREVRWMPGTGKLDAVAGFARFEAVEGEPATSLTYGLEHHGGGGGTDAAEAQALVAAFGRWMASARH